MEISALSSLKRNAVIAFNKGYRIIENECVNPKGKIIKGTKDKDGYRMFGNPKIKYHQLLAYQKYRNDWLFSDLIVRHLDDDKQNNTDENIVLGTHTDNMRDIPKHKRGKSMPALLANDEYRKKCTIAIRKSCGKCTDEMIINIKKDIKDNMRPCDIARKYNIGSQNVYHIKIGKTYKEIQ